VKNANSTWLNASRSTKTLVARWRREVRCANDANCLAVSEATDGAGAGKHVVFAVILGTGCGGGIAVDGRLHSGFEWSRGRMGPQHFAMDALRGVSGFACYCGRNGCIETWISGTGLEADYHRATGVALKGPRSSREATPGSGRACRPRSVRRPPHARFGASHQSAGSRCNCDGRGRFANSASLQNVAARLEEYVFGKEADTPILPAKHGDSSGVRGAAWLWPCRLVERRLGSE